MLRLLAALGAFGVAKALESRAHLTQRRRGYRLALNARLLSLLGLAGIAWAGAARASPQARLVYARSGAADSCPDEGALRRAVAARIGYDPFFPFAPRTVVVTLAAERDHLIARIQLVDNDGHAQGERRLDSRSTDCASLFDTVALTISIAIDPQALERPNSAPAQSPGLESAPSSAVASTPLPGAEPTLPPAVESTTPDVEFLPSSPGESPRPSATPRLAPGSMTSSRAQPLSEPLGRPSPGLRLGGSLRGLLGFTPGYAWGASVYADLAWERASIGVEAQADLPTSRQFAPASSLTVWLVAGALVPCLRLASFDLCALAIVGRLDATASNVISPAARVALYAGVGGRLGFSVPVAKRLWLRIQGDLLGNLSETTFVVGSPSGPGGATKAWEAPALDGALAIGVVASF